MKTKTIKAVLRKKVDNWIESITDKEVADIAKKNVVITGGSIVSMLMREPVNDFDIYFRTIEAASKVANYYVKIFNENSKVLHKGTGEVHPIYVENKDGRIKIIVKSAGVAKEGGTDEYQYFEGQQDMTTQSYVDALMPPAELEEPSYEGNLEKADEVAGETIDDGPPYRPVFLSSNAITLSNRIQLIMRFIGEPEEIHKYYDFIHCTCYWKSWDSELVLPPAALEAIITKELRYSGSLYPLCSIIRLRKFIARGWTVNAGQILKMCMQVSQLDLTKIDVLEDQLTGVDAFYFLQIIEQLRKKQADEGTTGQSIDGSYIMTIIDRLF